MQKIVICHNASEATAASAVTLKNALEQYATAFFDSFEVVTDSSETIVACKIGNVTALQIVYNASDDTVLRAANVDIKGIRYNQRIGIYNMYVLDNAICFEYGYFNTTYYLDKEAVCFLCKRTDGKTALLYASSQSSGSNRYRMANPGSAGYCIVSIDRSTGEANIGESPHYRNAGTQDVSGYSPFSIIDGVPIKNVYLNERTGFSYNYNNNVPFEYSLNGETFTAFRGNCICVKGT